MKKVIALMLVLCLALPLFGCGSNGAQEHDDPEERPVQTTAPTVEQTEEPKGQEEVPVTDWGVESSYYIYNSEKRIRVYVNFPERKGEAVGTGLLRKQPDSTTAIFDTYMEGHSPEVDSVEEMFPAYSEQLMKLFDYTLGSDYANNSVEVERDGGMTLNGYEIVRFRGVHFYTEGDSAKECQFVVYATQLHSSSEYVYVMVQDDSADQSQLELIESHAKSMILSLREE